MEERYSEYRRYLMVRCNNRIIQHLLVDIDYLTASANYVDIHVGQKVFRTRSTIKGIEQMLDPEMFGRIHRQTIVNVHRVKHCQRLAHGDYLVTMHHGIQLRMSRRYRIKNEMLGMMLTTSRKKLSEPSLQLKGGMMPQL